MQLIVGVVATFESDYLQPNMLPSQVRETLEIQSALCAGEVKG
jgi:hypothetical protein